MNSMLGALVGDAAGATLEFYRGPITESKVLNAMSMPGGGIIGVGKGQITDDGELTLALWTALNSSTKPTVHYAKWYDSTPFDIGQACSMAFEEYSNLYKKGEDVSEKTLEKIKEMNGESESNGALMRATAIATWVAKNKRYDALHGAIIAKDDAKLSHPSLVCQEANGIYVFAIIHLLRGMTPQETLERVNTLVNKMIKSEKIKKWYFEESLNIAEMNCKQSAGHLRWGFTLAFYFLRNPHISYEEAIKITLLKGGDTDTNACIVGGMLGAYKEIPDYMKNPVLTFDCTKENHIRPREYSVKQYFYN